MKRGMALLAVVLCLFGAAFALSAADSSRSLVYISPAPGARHISPTTSLAVRQGSPFDARQAQAEVFSVTGNKSGRHSGSARLSDDGLTLLYYPDQPFATGEVVSVIIRPGLTTTGGEPIAGVSYQFSILDRPIAELAAPAPTTSNDGTPPTEQAVSLAAPRYHTYPEFANVMTTSVTTPANGVMGDGYVFVSNLGAFTAFDPSLLILDNRGEPVYIQKTAGGNLTTDFKRQVVNGTPYLVYYQGVSSGGWASGTYDVMDVSYTIVDRWTIGNGYGSDMHDLQLLDNGHALMFNYTPIPIDLRPFGGPADGVLMDTVIQEQDAAKNVVFEWHGNQHVPLYDTYAALDRSPVDFMHTNAIELDRDGNLLISNRHLSQIIKIDRQTGSVIWRLGGKTNQFTLTNDGGFSFQHDIRRLANGHLTLFDNGNQHGPQYSRAVEYEIDEAAKTLTRVWQYPDDQSLYAAFMGSVQRLANGNTLIGWGGLPVVTEVRPNGSKAIEFSVGALSYRAYRYTWDARPSGAPRAVLSYAGDATTATIYSSWNGATGISGYDIYAGPNAGAMSIITTTTRSGFETTTVLDGLDPATCVFKVRPVRTQGGAAPFSPAMYRYDLPVCRALFSHSYYFPFVTRE